MKSVIFTTSNNAYVYGDQLKSLFDRFINTIDSKSVLVMDADTYKALEHTINSNEFRVLIVSRTYATTNHMVDRIGTFVDKDNLLLVQSYRLFKPLANLRLIDEVIQVKDLEDDKQSGANFETHYKTWKFAAVRKLKSVTHFQKRDIKMEDPVKPERITNKLIKETIRKVVQSL